MGRIEGHRPVLLLMAAFSRHAPALEWAKQIAIEHAGPLALESPVFDHEETKFYEASMGANLKKTFFVFEKLMDPTDLVQWKHVSNDWEAVYAELRKHNELRPVNIDPGYLTEAKLILATTKDRDHRIYLSRGIFAEVTLWFNHGEWKIRPWTYPDYQRPDYHTFFTECRNYLRQRYRQEFRG